MAASSAIVGRVEMRGAVELDNALRRLDMATAKGVLRKGLRVGARLVQQNVGSLIHSRSGRLARSVKVRAGKNNRQGRVSVVVTTGEGTFVGDIFYGGMVEWGHLTGKRGESGRIKLKNGRFRNVATGKARRKVAGEHFVEYGFDEAKDAAVEAVAQSMRESIDRIFDGGASDSGGGDA